MKFAILLSGCGQHDGSETHEVILTLLSLTQENIEWDAFAPDILQKKVINHLTDTQEGSESRQVLKESARLVRGKIKALSQADVSQYDAIILPGGLGAVSNLCDWADRGNDFTFEKEVGEFLDAGVTHKKPMGFICIAPVMIPKLFPNAKLTIGNDEKIAAQLEGQGATHINCLATEIAIDETNKVVSTPANMCAKDIAEVYEGIHKLVKALANMC